MSRTPQMWHPDLHPRWPRGAPASKGGEFRDQHGGAMPVAGGGSIPTGKVASCDSCGRTVKVVGNGKLSTHNASKGKRCPGSGTVPTGSSGTGRQVRSETKAKAPRSKDIQPKTWPRLLPGIYSSRADDPDARRRMAQWEADTKRPGRTQAPSRSVREVKLDQARKTLASYEVGLQRAREQGRILSIRTIMHDIDTQKDWIADLESRHSRTIFSPNGDPYSPGFLDSTDNSEYRYQPAQQYDPARPLAVYGDMLHFDDSWLSYMALQSLEERVPPQYHAAIASYLAEQRAGGFSSAGGGIWIAGQTKLPDLDDLGYLHQQTPRGWHQGATWSDVDGVVAHYGTVMAVSYTANTDSHRGTRANLREVGRGASTGNPAGDLHRSHVDASATLHEFGHLADRALGGKNAKGNWQRASEQRGWRLVYQEVLREGGRGLNPYYKQRKTDKNGKKLSAVDVDSSAEELWADAFGEWAATDPTPVTWDDGTPRMFGIYGSADARRHDIVTSSRPLTWQIKAMAATYDVPYDTAAKMVDYFDQHATQVRTGKRKPYTTGRRT